MYQFTLKYNQNKVVGKYPTISGVCRQDKLQKPGVVPNDPNLMGRREAAWPRRIPCERGHHQTTRKTKNTTISPLPNLPKILDETPSDSNKSMNSKSTKIEIDANKTGETKELTESKLTQFFVKVKVCWAIIFFIIIFFFVFWIFRALY